MEFYDFQLRGWATDQRQVAAFVHSSPAGAMRHPQMTSPNWESLGQFEDLLHSAVMQTDFARLREGGQELAQALFPGDVEKLLMESLDEVGSGYGLRVRLCLDAALSKLPWEYLYLPCIGGFVTQDSRFSLVREPPQPGRKTPIPGEKRQMLFYGVRNCAPDGSDQWQIAAERDKLVQAIKPAHALFKMRSFISNECDCKTALQRTGTPIDIFHYSGHTNVENGMGYLIAEEMHQDRRSPARLNADALGSMLRLAGTTIAVFSACNSGNWEFVQPLLREGVPVVIGARGLVEVRVATNFCERLYDALAIGLSLDEAASWARLHLLEPDVLPEFLRWQWGTFIVYMQTPEAVLFPRPREPEVVVEQSAARVARQRTIDHVIREEVPGPVFLDWSAVDETARGSTLYVETIIKKKDGTDRRVEHGSAFVSKTIPGGAQALTAAHVVPEPGSDEIAEYKVALRSKQAHLAGVKVVKRDRDLDIALLSLPDTDKWIALSTGKSSAIGLGSPLYTLGFPLDSDLAGASGILSNVQGPKGRWQTTLPIEHGNSGGPVLNTEGKVVAVASGGIDDTRAITYTIPIDYIRL
jgi:hypothetical protein